MFTKKEVVAGSIAVLFFLLYGLFLFLWVLDEPGLVEPLITNTRIAITVAWIITIYTAFAMLVSILIIVKEGEHKKRLDYRLTIKLVIPGHFYYVIAPLAIGMGLTFLTGLQDWGLGLSLISFPMLAIFLVISLRKGT